MSIVPQILKGAERRKEGDGAPSAEHVELKGTPERSLAPAAFLAASLLLFPIFFFAFSLSSLFLFPSFLPLPFLKTISLF